jgi:hypothetical protein
LTPGNYELVIFDQEENSLHRWLTRDLGLSSVPFTFELQAVPIVQNEERVMCGDKLYLSEWFIQNRFIEGRGGQRFTFDDNIILSLMTPVQKVNIHPEEDMLIKINSKQAFGVNMKIRVCDKHGKCDLESTRIGNTEILFGVVSKGTEY